MRVKNAISDSGERFSVLLGEDGLPMFYPNLFVTSSYRNNDNSPNTCKKVREEIAFLYEVCSLINLKIEDRCANHQFFTHEEINQIAQYSGLTKEFVLRSKKEHTNIIPIKRTKRKRLETVRYTIVDDAEADKVFWQTKYNRLSVFGNYLDWLERLHSPYKETKTKQLFDELRPNKSQQKTYWEILEGYNFKSLNQQQRNVFLDRIRVNYPESVWKNEGVRYRNYLLAIMLYTLGLRISEALNIKIEDIKPKNNNNFVYIRHNRDAKDDPRLNQPLLKTNSRALQLTDKLKLIIENYLFEYRSKVKNSSACPFLFISHKTLQSKVQPLSISAAEKVFREFSSILGFKLTPHMLRHTWNDRYSEAMDKKIANGNITEDKAESDRCHLMGWAKGSTMNLIYSARYNTERAMRTALVMQDADFETKESIAYDEDISM